MCGCFKLQSKWCTEGEMSSPSALHTLLRAWNLHSPHCNLISTSLAPGFRRITPAWHKSSLELPAWIGEKTRGVWGAVSSLQPSSFKSNLNSNFKSNVEVTSDWTCGLDLSPQKSQCQQFARCHCSWECQCSWEWRYLSPTYFVKSLLSFLGSHIRQGQRGAAVRDADKLSDSLFKKERAL